MSDRVASEAGVVGEWAELRSRFEAAWELARQGGPEPSVEGYLGEVVEPQRGEARKALEAIEERHRRWLEESNLETLAGGETGSDIRSSVSSVGGSLQADFSMGASGGGTGDDGATMDQTAGPLPDAEDEGPDGEPGATVAFEESGRTVGNDPYGATVAADAPGASAVAGRKEQPRKAVEVAGYEIVDELGRGGMGVVYKARQTKLNRLVALKMIIAGEHAGEEQLARFQIEAESVASLQHPNIVQIFEVGDKGGMPYFSLEFVDGGSLQQSIEGKPQAPRFSAQMAESLARAMAAAHERGVIHRDLKPANILMTLNGTPKITDFGLAKKVDGDSRQTRSGALMGTPSYMAPEQARGDTREIGPLSDLYALGAILYELLTGRPPFRGATILDTLDQVRSQEPVPPTRLQPKVPRDLETICLKCLQKEPRKRYGSAGELADDLKRFLDGEAILARPVTVFERGWRWCRRNPRVAALSAMVGGLLVTVAIGGLVVKARVEREQGLENNARIAANERYGEASTAITTGQSARALDLLKASDPLLKTSPNLEKERQRLERLRRQVELYVEFEEKLEEARFSALFGDERRRSKAWEQLKALVALYDQIEGKRGRGQVGLPALSEKQNQLFKEDVFDMFLIAAQAGWEDAAATGRSQAKDEAARRAVAWLDRAEAILPGTKALVVQRMFYRDYLGDEEGSKRDREAAESIVPTLPVDHFWHAFACHGRLSEALRTNDGAKANQEYQEARSELSMLLQTRPDHFWGYLEWGTCQYDVGDYLDAVIGYSACIELRPEAPWPYNNRATAYLRLAGQAKGDERRKQDALERALADYDQALALDEGYQEVLDGRGHVFLERKEPKRALEDFDRALALGYATASVYLGRAQAHEALGMWKAAVEDYDRLVELEERNAQVQYQRAVAKYRVNDLEGAREAFSKVMELLPVDPTPVRDRANVNIALRDFEAAIRDWELAARLQPKSAEPHYYQGVLRMGQRRYEEARAAIEEALKRDPRHALALLARARLNYWEGKLEQALVDINQVVDEIDPKNAYYLNDRPDVLRALGRLEDARRDCERSIELDPEQRDAYVSLARLLREEAKPEEARAALDRMVEANEKDFRAWLMRAESRRDEGEFEKSRADCERARVLAPEEVLPELVRAGIEAAEGHTAEAVEAVERLLPKAKPGEGHALYEAACAYSLASRARREAGDSAGALGYADRAQALLSEALARGFHDLNYQEQDRMLSDPALGAIRGRAEVEGLIRHRPGSLGRGAETAAKESGG